MEEKRLLNRKEKLVLVIQKPLLGLRRVVSKLLIGNGAVKEDIIDLENRITYLNLEIKHLRRQLKGVEEEKIKDPEPLV